MAYVITEPCIGTCDTACVKICPVDCIHGPKIIEEMEGAPEPKRKVALKAIQMYIEPDACIDCGACVPECPVKAIFEESDVPSKWHSYIAKNAAYFKQKNSAYLK
jgi:NAD-dependent dihydropyrimidine dehydrogenase PreA subunit